MPINGRDAARRRPGPRFPDLAATPLALLLEAYEGAREAGVDRWEFSVELAALRDAGLTPTQLRWLLLGGYLVEAVEMTRPEDEGRSFRRVVNLSLSERACFVLTDTGAVQAHAVLRDGKPQEGGAPVRPVWDGERRELRIGDVVVKRFKQPAANQERVLAAFEEEGWPPRIDDPLPPLQEQDGRARLHATISNLNRGQGPGRIVFGGGGDGESVCWNTPPPQSATTERRQSDSCRGPKGPIILARSRRQG
jgi:hypothetical protein